MEDQLILFETAKLAKEKGFDWNTFFYHASFNDEYLSEDLKQGYSGSGIPASNWNSQQKMQETELYSAPTQSLLQKWLREKHLIDVWLSFGKMGGWKPLVSSRNGDYTEGYTTLLWENALEAGLLEALKLINQK